MTESITLRSHLMGALNDLVESANLGMLGKCSIVCELVSLFADYEEEGTALYLDAFLTENLQKLTATIPLSTSLRLGSTTCDESGVRRAVKRVAPLVRGCWKMYLAIQGSELEFGLFRDSGHPLNVPLDVALVEGGAAEARYIRITKLARDTVRATTHHGKVSVVHFTNAREVASVDGGSIATLCQIICSNLEEKLAQSSKTYLEHLISSAIRGAHGSLIAVVRDPKLPDFLSDCTPLIPPLNLSEAIDAVRRNSESIPQLHALEHIVCGMFCCDGIVVLDTGANVVAYNAFVTLEASNVVGGARRRAFQALVGRVGSELKAAFFQSQDGGSDLRRSES